MAKTLSVFNQGVNLEPGTAFYLVEVDFLNTGEHRWDIQADCPRTNMSNEERAKGWLGTANNVCENAHGQKRLVRWVGGNNDLPKIKYEDVVDDNG